MCVSVCVCGVGGGCISFFIQFGFALYDIHNLGAAVLSSVHPVETSTSLHTYRLK